MAELVALKEPAGQATHAASAREEKKPAAQGVQLPEPETSETLPAGQGEQEEAPGKE